ncbi:MAG: glutathione S-transferase family protein [Dongiaceae bacterium]
MLKIHGVPFSAHTRKVIVAAREKAIPFELVPVVPLKPPAGWTDLSPLGLIPAIEDDGVRLADSSVINLYLERRHPKPPLYPQEAGAYGQALWIEEFVDSGLAPHVLRGLLMQRVFAPKFLNQPPDEALIKKSLTEMIPQRLNYLEKALDGDYFAGNSFSAADIAVGCMLVNFHFAGETLAEKSYPKLHRCFRKILARDCFEKALAAEFKSADSIGGLDMSLHRSLGHG